MQEPPLSEIESRLLAAVAAERGHFRYESGHHGDLWLDLDRLLIDAGGTRALASALAERAVACWPDVACGPLTGGAFARSSSPQQSGPASSSPNGSLQDSR